MSMMPMASATSAASSSRARIKWTISCARFGAQYFDSDYICVYEDGKPVGKNAFSRAMKGVCRYHDLRHINGTQSLAAGHDPMTVAHRLGNDPQTLIKLYAHLVAEKERESPI